MLSSKAGKIKRLTRELHALTEVSKTITARLELAQLLDAIMGRIIGVLEPADVGTIMLWDESAGLFRPVAAFGYDLELLSILGLRAGESITGKIYDSGQVRIFCTPQEISHAMADMRSANRKAMARAFGSDELPRCIVAAPIAVDDRKFGVLVLENIKNPAIFYEDDLPFVQTLADLIALAIERARLDAQADVVMEAQRIEHMRSEVMATLSHELRMPLTVIQGYSSALMLDEVEWSEAKRNEFLNLIEQECEDMQAMIQDILDTSLIEVDQLAIQCEPLRLQHLVHDLALEIQHRTDAHRLVIDFPSDFPIVEADPHWIKQVFRNILDNAIKYSPNGGLVVINWTLDKD